MMNSIRIIGRERHHEPTLTPENREKLRNISAATITTALFKRNLRNQAHPGTSARLGTRGAARDGRRGRSTLRYIPAREDLDHIKVFEDRSHPQRSTIEESPPGHVLVIDQPQGMRRRGLAGGILITRLMMRKARPES